MKSILLSMFCFLMLQSGHSQQKFLTKSGTITFFSDSPLEEIKAENKQVLSIIDTKDGSIAIAILMKSFQFKKSLMQEHFNENYLESDVYPKATFKGKILNFEKLIKGEQVVSIKGSLTIHGVTNEVVIEANMITSEEVVLKGNFTINLADYNIEIPSVVKNNIAKSILIDFELNHKLYK